MEKFIERASRVVIVGLALAALYLQVLCLLVIAGNLKAVHEDQLLLTCKAVSSQETFVCLVERQ